MVVAALQETKWFGNAVYKVGQSVVHVLTAGREVPGAEVVKQRGEGAAIVLSGPAVSPWMASGSKWKAWSSRLVTATLYGSCEWEKRTSSSALMLCTHHCCQ